MARMIPAVPREFDERSREGEMFYALERLPDEYTVVHSFRIVRVENKVIHESETDFVIIHPDKGILFLEAKASKYGYSYMNGEWYYGSQQTRGCRTPVKMTYGGPMEEALRAKRNFEKKVADANLSVLLEDCRVDSAVWFISATRAELEQMPLPSEIDKRLFLTEESLVEIEDDINRIFEIHRYNERMTTMSKKAIETLLSNIICPEFDLIPSIGVSITDKRLAFNRLLEEQSRLLDYLVDQPVGVINGAAGTGKTMLAVEMARRYAEQGERTLFLCYNRMLCEYLQATKANDLVDYYNIDSYAVKLTPSHTIDYAELHDALLEEKTPFPYQHVIVDEGQDFGKELIENAELFDLFELLVTGGEKNGTFFVFYDSNQLNQANAMPKYIKNADCRLTLYRNSRNTHCIAQTSAKPLPDTRRIKLSDKCLEGEPPVFMFAETADDTRKCVDQMLEKLMDAGYSNIQLLTMTTDERSIIAPFIRQDGGYRFRSSTIPFTTCRKFKGLEADAVILLDVDRSVFDDFNTKCNFYVGTSRARLALRIVSTLSMDSCKEIAAEKQLPKTSKNPQKVIANYFQCGLKKIEQ